MAYVYTYAIVMTAVITSSCAGYAFRGVFCDSTRAQRIGNGIGLLLYVPAAAWSVAVAVGHLS